MNKLSYLLRYIPDWYKTQRMYDEAIPENGGNQEMCNETIAISRNALKFFPKCYRTQKCHRTHIKLNKYIT